jgi:hypothetical protein
MLLPFSWLDLLCLLPTLTYSVTLAQRLNLPSSLPHEMLVLRWYH